MDHLLVQEFSQYLQLQGASKATIKNYRADLGKFVEWYENKFKQFTPSALTIQIILLYKKEQSQKQEAFSGLSYRSVERYFSTLRKFCSFLKAQRIIEQSPFEQIKIEEQKNQESADTWKLKKFKSQLYQENLSKLTIKNYINDIHQFVLWLTQVNSGFKKVQLQTRYIPFNLTPAVVEEYKARLLNFAELSPITINRKLSSIRRFMDWHQQINGTSANMMGLNNVPVRKPEAEMLLIPPATESVVSYSRFPPMRLAQKSIKALLFVFDSMVSVPLSVLVAKTQYLLFRSQKRHIFQSLNHIKAKSYTVIPNFKKEFYAPLSIHTKVSNVYKKPRKFPLIWFVHVVILLLFLGTIGYGVRTFMVNISKEKKILGARVNAQNRFITLKQKLTDRNNYAITNPTTLRFALYNSQVGSGSALLWQEVKQVIPDSQGVFTINLGGKNPIPESLFNAPALWLGVTIEDNPEMNPRQELPTVNLSHNSELLQGMLPITAPKAPTRNVLLALDSSGDLSIGNGANPTFEATGGQFRLSGQPLVLATNKGSAGNVEISPDGTGTVDVQKPLQNSTEYGNVPSAAGALEVDDLFVVLASSSGQSAITVNQNNIGPIISASSSGIAKFTVSNDGSGYFAGYLGIGTQSPNAALDVQGVATISAGITLGATALIQATQYQSLTLGGPTTGAIILSPGSLTPSFIVQNGGNVGIGTTTPKAKLMITTTSNNDGIQLNGTSNPALSYYNNGTLKGYIGLVTNNGSFNDSNAKSGDFVIRTDDGSNGAIRFVSQGGSLETFTILRSGNVGVNNPSPQASVDVSGSIVARTNLYQTNLDALGSSQTLCFQSVTVGSTTNKIGQCASDERLKENIVYFDQNGVDALVIIKALKPAQFDFKTGTKNEYGFIAQDITHVLPNTVHKGSDGYFTFNKDALIPFTIKALQQLDQKLENEQIQSATLAGQIKAINISLVDLTMAKDPQTNDYTIYNNGKSIQDRVGAFAKAVAANIEAGALKAQEVTTRSLSVTTTNIRISGVNLENYIAGIVEKLINNSIDTEKLTESFDHDVATVRIGTISPIGNSLVIKLATSSGTARLEIQNASGSAVATVDDAGNASFSGQLASNSLQTQEASVEGTLRAGKIIANDIEGLDNKLATLAAIPAPTPSSPDIPTISNLPTATSSASFLDLAAEFSKFNQGLIALGPTSLMNTSINGQLTIGRLFKIEETSLNVLGDNLQIQPLRQGGISFLSGLIHIDTDGNAVFGKNVTVHGILTAGIITPIPDSDLVVQLNSNPFNSSFMVKNASASAVFAVNQLGDLIASGSATISKLNFRLAEPALALSDIEARASGSAGVATISAQRKELTIQNPLVTEKSLIYITPVGTPSGTIPFLLRQIPNQSFTIGIEIESPNSVMFNWLIIN